jgi:hypothetical protein
MNTSRHQSRYRFPQKLNSSLIESLEGRRLLSVAVPMATTTYISPPLMPTAPIAITPVVLSGTKIHAETDQAFRAVIGTIRGLPALPSGYTLQGEIDWGDGTPPSAAQFVPQADGTAAGAIAVLGAHTYTAVGSDDIRVVVTAVPPPWSEAPVRFIGSFHSKANVIAPNGGVTLNETAGVSFTAQLGFFHTTLPASTLTAVIDWNDGTQSLGKIVELPTAGILPTFAVVGTHTYAATASYLVHMTVYSSYPSPIVSPTATTTPTTTPPVILVAQIDSVIDVLPRFDEIV